MPLAETLLTSVLTNLTTKSLGFVSSAVLERDDLVDLELWSVAIADDFGEIVGILTSDQTQDLAKFLGSIEVSSLFQAHFLGRLAEADQGGIGDLNVRLCDAFEKLANRWCSQSGQNWSSLAIDIWDGISRRMVSVLPAENILAELPRDEIEMFREQMEVEGATSKIRKGVPRFLRDLLGMSTDLERVVAARDTVVDLRRGLREYYAQIRLDHARNDFRIQIDKLYIDRRLVKKGSSEELEAAKVVNSSDKMRIVVTGDPGIGKSTFTEYLVKQMSDSMDGYRAPLILSCKEYAIGGGQGLVELLKSKIETSLQLSVSDSDIEDILTLGWGFVILDGVDEILDLSLRRRFIRAAEAFARRFPLCSVVATSRNVGYLEAQFDQKRFTRYELQSFTDVEIEEYARKWFALAERPESHLERFLIELNSIPDLRGNPLLLSLLCILYRDRGHIPRNRRQIYSQCADLLFNRWDPMRDIEQPYDHQHYGEELMQEIAHWFYKSQAAQAGVEEQQLQHVISGFLRDAAAVPPVDANRRAKSFLDFCADRAWLLGAAGSNERGQRVFVFTHRTFMEFFAAEYLARTLELDKIVVEVADVYDKDASSVLPDLMIQSAEFHRRGGARQIISGLLGKGGILSGRKLDRYLPLCLRIVNLSPVYPSLVDDIFERTLASWRKYAPSVSMESMKCVLELYRDPRSRFMNRLWEDGAMDEFMVRWAVLYISDACGPYEEEWGEFVRDAVSSEIQHLSTLNYIVLKHFLVDMECMAPEKDVTGGLVVTVPGFGVEAGYALRSIERKLWGTSKGFDNFVTAKLGNEAVKGKKIDFSVMFRLDKVLKERTLFMSYRTNAIEDRELRSILAWLGCAIFEASGSVNPFHDDIAVTCGLDFPSLFSTRNFYLDRQGRLDGEIKAEANVERQYGDVLNPSQLASTLEGFEPWLRRWCEAKKDLVMIPSDEN